MSKLFDQVKTDLLQTLIDHAKTKGDDLQKKFAEGAQEQLDRAGNVINTLDDKLEANGVSTDLEGIKGDAKRGFARLVEMYKNDLHQMIWNNLAVIVVWSLFLGPVVGGLTYWLRG